MEPPRIFSRKPDIRDVTPGSYFWCSCGYSDTQPFCDGQHIRHGMMPVMLDVPEKRTIAFCNCKHTKNPPYCDGSHSKL